MIYSVKSSLIAKYYYSECTWALSKLEKKTLQAAPPVVELFKLFKV